MAVLKTLLNNAPCFMRYKSQAQGSIDGNGDPVQGESEWSSPIPCDAVPAGRANERVFEDGVRRSYSHTIYLKKDCPELYFGQTIELRYANSESVSVHSVLGFHRYQLQAKVWV